MPSPPATPSRSAPSATALRASAAGSGSLSRSSRITLAPSASARSTRPCSPTLPPPDRGFMISTGLRGGRTERDLLPRGARSRRSALRALASAATHSPSATAANGHRPETAYSTRTATGAANASRAPHTRAMPRCATAHHRPAPARAMPTRPSNSSSHWPAATTAATTPARQSRASRARLCASRREPSGTASSFALVAFMIPRAVRCGAWPARVAPRPHAREPAPPHPSMIHAAWWPHDLMPGQGRGAPHRTADALSGSRHAARPGRSGSWSGPRRHAAGSCRGSTAACGPRR